MSQSIKKNFVFNLINTVSALVFPLITFPYASRILMADGIGLVQFFQSIINYVVLLTSIGIPLYGIKEIARARDNKEELSRTTIELVTLSVILSLVGYIIVAILCLTVGKVQENIPLFLILSSTILITSIGCPWFYSGIEDFKYITVVGILVKTLCAIFLFCIVKTRDDLLLYGAYTVAGSIGSYLINFVRLRKYISFEGISLKDLNIWRHIKPAAAIFLFNIVTSIYINLDTVMLGFLSNSTAVGYYTGATKISHILVVLVTSLGAVLLPRSSNLLKNGKTDEFYALSAKSYNFISLMAFPILGGVLVLAPSIILLFCGSGFVPSITTLRIIAPIIVFIGISNLVGLQMLYPLGKIKLVTISTCIGAAVNLTLNLILIPLLAQNGAAVATVIAELSVAIAQLLMVRKLIPFSLINKDTFKYFVSSLLMALICYGIMPLLGNDVIRIIVVSFVGMLVYGTIMLLSKDELTMSIWEQLKGHIIKNNG